MTSLAETSSVSRPIDGLMQDYPLTLHHVFWRLEKLFGITRFRVDPGLTEIGSTGSEQNAAARITVEQQIAHNLTITYVSNVNSTQQQVIQVEYNVNRNVSIVALRDYNGTFGIDIKIKKRFD